MSRQHMARTKAPPQRNRSDRTAAPKLRSAGPMAADLQRRLGNRGAFAWLSDNTPSGTTENTAQRVSRPRESGSPTVALLSRQTSRPIQRKLTVGKADDAYEREADEVATAVMRMPDPGLFRKPT